jgi:LuxR family transcriptional regulator, maltose regulon positive regulatory protein
MDGLAEPLSAREQAVLELLAAGLVNEEIARRLFVTAGTVKTHLKSIYGKLGVHTRTEAVARARALTLL